MRHTICDIISLYYLFWAAIRPCAFLVLRVFHRAFPLWATIVQFYTGCCGWLSFHLKPRTKEKYQSNEVSLIFVHLFFYHSACVCLLIFSHSLLPSLHFWLLGLFLYIYFFIVCFVCTVGMAFYKMSRLVGTHIRMRSKLLGQMSVRYTSSFSSSDINSRPRGIKTAQDLAHGSKRVEPEV